jgi:hypothetical protein
MIDMRVPAIDPACIHHSTVPILRERACLQTGRLAGCVTREQRTPGLCRSVIARGPTHLNYLHPFKHEVLYVCIYVFIYIYIYTKFINAAIL